MPRSRPSKAGLPLLVKEIICELSDDRRFREQPLSVVQRFRGRSNRRMSLRSLGGQLCLPVRVPFQTYHMLSAMSLAQLFHFALCGGLHATGPVSPVCFGNEHRSANIFEAAPITLCVPAKSDWSTVPLCPCSVPDIPSVFGNESSSTLPGSSLELGKIQLVRVPRCVSATTIAQSCEYILLDA